MNDTKNTPKQHNESNDPLTKAITKAEQVAKQYQEYLDADQNESATAEHPKPSNEELMDMFSELKKQTELNIRSIELKKLYRILLLLDKFMEIHIGMGIFIPDELSNYSDRVVALVKARTKMAKVFDRAKEEA